MATITPIPPEKRFQDLTGQRFGRLVVLGLAKPRSTALWLCRCDCGNEKAVYASSLRDAHRQSCGCLKLDAITTSGSADFCAKNTREYKEYPVWKQMINRCHNPKSNVFSDYGGRGITVCDRWRYGENGEHGFSCFMADMGARPSDAHTIDRLNNELGYSPSNCAWATRNEQAINRRNSIFVKYQGVRMPLVEASKMAGIPYGTVYDRLFTQGWTQEQALDNSAGKHENRGTQSN